MKLICGLVSRTSAEMFTKLKISYNIYGFLILYFLTPSSKQQRHLPQHTDSFLVRVTIIHCESIFLNTIINGMLLSFIAYHKITHAVEIP